MQFPQQNKMPYDPNFPQPQNEEDYPQYPPGGMPNWSAYNYEIPPHSASNFNQQKPLPPQQGYYNQRPYTNNPEPSNFNPHELLANPLANVAMQYGTQIMGSGKQMVDKEINRFITVAKLRYFFSVDTHYVINKLKLIMFPYTNKDWSLKYNEKSRLEPRYDHNAPDLYIPFMGYITYVLVAGLVLGTKDLFSPEVLGIIASQALAMLVAEIILQLITIYFINIPTNLTFLDLMAYSGYKFVGSIVCILLGLLFSKQGYLISLIYCGASTAFFMVQALKWRLMSEVEDTWNDHPQNPSYTQIAYKRKMYFLLMIGLSHILQIWWLSSCLDRQKV